MTGQFLTYQPGAQFPGTIGRTLETSSEAWPARRTPPPDAPNVVVIVLDDIGYGQLAPFGGLCQTETLERLALGGLRFSNFHTTALCSPTRACLLTGRNHHAVGMSAITQLSLGFPAHNAMMGAEHGMISEILLAHGYNTFCVGKWHLTPPEESTAAGPYDRWPLGRGFERYYGFLGGDTDQFHPELIHDNHPVRPPRTPAEGYHLNADLADHAIEFIKGAHTSAPDKPFFLWYATAAGHAPHQVEPEWAARYKGSFDLGWDEYRRVVFERQRALGLLPSQARLSERDPDVEPWDSLSDHARRMYARQMEVFAGFVSQTDYHIGRVVDFIEQIGELDNTLILCVSDNGASAEGGIHGTRNAALFFNVVPQRLEENLDVFDKWGSEDTFNHYSWGWTWAGDTPFRRWKRETYRGGVTDPCILWWPRGIDSPGETRAQFVHAIDVAPTILEAIGLDPSKSLRGVSQTPMHGRSFAPAFNNPNAPEEARAQYFEMFGHRSIYRDGWKAVCPYPGPSLAEGRERGHPFGSPLTEEILDDIEAHDWELYDLMADPTECQDLAARCPEILSELKALWWHEAEKYGVLPLAAADLGRLFAQRPTVSAFRQVYEFYPGRMPIAAAPRLSNRPYSITAYADIPEEGAEGVLLTQGNRHGGYAFLVSNGRLSFVYNFLGLRTFSVSASEPVPPGHTSLRVEFAPTGPPVFRMGQGSPGEIRLYHETKLVGFAAIPFSVPVRFASSGASCGLAFLDSIDPSAYSAPFEFTGDLDKVVLDVSGELYVSPTAEMTGLFSQQ
jgi:arylsulfatase A-like enzyme